MYREVPTQPDFPKPPGPFRTFRGADATPLAAAAALLLAAEEHLIEKIKQGREDAIRGLFEPALPYGKEYTVFVTELGGKNERIDITEKTNGPALFSANTIKIDIVGRGLGPAPDEIRFMRDDLQWRPFDPNLQVTAHVHSNEFNSGEKRVIDRTKPLDRRWSDGEPGCPREPRFESPFDRPSRPGPIRDPSK